MLNKIDIPGTDITLEIVDKTITITNKQDLSTQDEMQIVSPVKNLKKRISAGCSIAQGLRR